MSERIKRIDLPALSGFAALADFRRRDPRDCVHGFMRQTGGHPDDCPLGF